MFKRSSVQYVTDLVPAKKNKPNSKKVHLTEPVVQRPFLATENMYQKNTVEQVSNNIFTSVTSSYVSTLTSSSPSVQKRTPLSEPVREERKFTEWESENTLTQLHVVDTNDIHSSASSDDESEHSNTYITAGSNLQRTIRLGSISSGSDTQIEIQSDVEQESEGEETRRSSSPELHMLYDTQVEQDTEVQATHSDLLISNLKEIEDNSVEETIPETQDVQIPHTNSHTDCQTRSMSPTLSAHTPNDNHLAHFSARHSPNAIPESILESRNSNLERFSDESWSVIPESEIDSSYTTTYNHQHDSQNSENSYSEFSSESDEEETMITLDTESYRPDLYNTTKVPSSTPRVFLKKRPARNYAPSPLPFRPMVSELSPSVIKPKRNRLHVALKKSMATGPGPDLYADSSGSKRVVTEHVANSQSEDSDLENIQSSQAADVLVNKTIIITEQVEDSESEESNVEIIKSADALNSPIIEHVVNSQSEDLNLENTHFSQTVDELTDEVGSRTDQVQDSANRESNTKRGRTSRTANVLAKKLVTSNQIENDQHEDSAKEKSHQFMTSVDNRNTKPGKYKQYPRKSFPSKTLRGVLDKKKRIDGTFYLVHFHGETQPEWIPLTELASFQQEISEYEATTREYFRDLSLLETEVGFEDDTDSNSEEPIRASFSVLSR